MSTVTILIQHEPRNSSFSPTWRAAAPGRSCIELAIGQTRYDVFLRLWSAVSQSLRYWDRAGRPAPAWNL